MKSKDNTCLKESKFVEIEWKMKGNNELTLLQMKIMGEKLDDVKKDSAETNKLLREYIEEQKKKDEIEKERLNQRFEEQEKKFIKIDTIKLVFIVLSIVSSIIIWAWSLISYLHPLLTK